MAKARDFVGDYRLVRMISNGASTQVWEASDREGQKRFAVKMIRDPNKASKEEVASLKHEYEVAKSLNSPLVLKTFAHAVDKGTAYSVFELFSETSLRNLLRMGMDVAGFMYPAAIQKSAEALYYLHTKEWIHRDIKPDNFLVAREGELKLIDYRIAEKKRTGLKAMFYKPKVQGTRSYMAPEAILGNKIDERSDIYSYGCMLYELVVGKAPFTGNNPDELLNKHLSAQVPSATASNSNVTPEFSEMVKSCMAKKVENRPSSLWEVVKLLRTTSVFKKLPRAGEVHPFDQLEKGQTGFDIG